MKTSITLLCCAAVCRTLLAGDASEPSRASALLQNASADQPSCCPPKPSCCAEEKPSAPLTERSLYQLGSTWTDDAGDSVSLAALRGRPVVLAMFFASCEYACPVLVNDMQRLRALLPDDVRAAAQFVLVTFDPARDTPEALRAFRERMTLDGATWTLLRADDDSVRELAMLLGVKYKQDTRGQFAHSNQITVKRLGHWRRARASCSSRHFCRRRCSRSCTARASRRCRSAAAMVPGRRGFGGGSEAKLGGTASAPSGNANRLSVRCHGRRGGRPSKIASPRQRMRG